jgi:hypothetical protein
VDDAPTCVTNEHAGGKSIETVGHCRRFDFVKIDHPTD